MLTQSLTKQGERFYPIPRENGFFLTARMESNADGSYVLRDLADQDFKRGGVRATATARLGWSTPTPAFNELVFIYISVQVIT